MLAESISSK